MFGLFNKKEMDTEAANRFWNWFVENEDWIISNINTNGMDVVWAVDEQIKPVFPYWKKELEFQLGFNNGEGEFFFFHFGNKILMNDSVVFKNMMPKKLLERWVFITEK